MPFVKLSDDGNIETNQDGSIATISDADAPVQFAKAECRCEQGTWFANAFFGRNPLFWKLSQSETDRIVDLKRICGQYRTVISITFTDEDKFVIDL